MKKLLYIILFLSFSVPAINSFSKNDDDTIAKKDNSLIINRITNDDINVSVPSLIFGFKDTDIKLKFKNPRHGRLILNNDKIHFIINGEDTELTFIKGEAHFTKKFDTNKTLTIYTEGFSYSTKITVFPVWAIVLPIALLILWGLWSIRKTLRK